MVDCEASVTLRPALRTLYYYLHLIAHARRPRRTYYNSDEIFIRNFNECALRSCGGVAVA